MRESLLLCVDPLYARTPRAPRWGKRDGAKAPKANVIVVGGAMPSLDELDDWDSVRPCGASFPFHSGRGGRPPRRNRWTARAVCYPHRALSYISRHIASCLRSAHC